MTNAELAILGLVVERPRHGYEIEQVIEERGMREWTEVGFSSIYYLLKKLERRGFVESQLQEAERGPARRVYQATAEGQAALRAGVLDALSVPRRSYPPIQLGLSHLPGIPASQAASALREYQTALSTRLARLQERRESQRPLPLFIEAMFQHSAALLEAEIAWTKDLRTQMEAEDVQSRFQEGA